VTSIVYSETDLTVWQMPAGSDYQLFLRSELRSAIRIERTAKGKPFLVDSGWRFNVSHSGSWQLIALSRNEVGVDIECARPVKFRQAIVERYFPNQYICDDEAFLRAWVRREALLKGIGVGLAGLSTVSPTPTGWTVVDLSVPHGYFGALAKAGG
jgi:4'-phosphopantetheinyl transferase